MPRSAARLRPVAAAEGTQYNVHIGKRLRALRLRRDWSIEEAASRAGLSRNTLGNLELAPIPNPRLATLLALMEAYEMRGIEELLGDLPSRALLQAWVAQGRPGVR